MGPLERAIREDDLMLLRGLIDEQPSLTSMRIAWQDPSALPDHCGNDSLRALFQEHIR